MPAYDPKGQIFHQDSVIVPGVTVRHTFTWTADSAGDAARNGIVLNGEAMWIEYSNNTGSGTYTVYLYDPLGQDALRGLVATIAVSTSARKDLAQTYTHDGATFSRGLRLSGVYSLVVDCSAAAANNGVIDLYLRP